MLLLLPTGYGKSACYLAPAGMRPGLTVVLCPLVALVDDQCRQASAASLQSAALHSGMSDTARRRVLARLWGAARAPMATLQRAATVYCSGVPGVKDEAPPSVLDVLVTTPEQLLHSSPLRAALSALHARRLLARFVVDEAHVLARWGPGFRPALL